MRIRRLRDRLAILLALALGIAGLAALPAASAAAAGAPAEIHGLKGEYYTQSAPGAFDFADLKATGVDPNLDFDNLEPRLAFTTGRSDDVSVRWTGKVVPAKTGPTPSRSSATTASASGSADSSSSTTGSTTGTPNRPPPRSS